MFKRLFRKRCPKPQHEDFFMSPEVQNAIATIQAAFAAQKAADQKALDDAVAQAQAAHADDVVQLQAAAAQLQAAIAAVAPTAPITASPQVANPTTQDAQPTPPAQ